MVNAKNVNVATTGAVYGDVSTAVTGPTSPLPGATSYGYISEEGVSISSDRSTSNILAWQNADVVRTITTEASATYAFTVIENTKAARELYYGSEEDAVSGLIKWNPRNAKRGAFVIDAFDEAMADGKLMAVRHYIPDAEVTSVESITLANGNAIGFGVTLTAYNVSGRVADVYHVELDAGAIDPSEDITAGAALRIGSSSE